MLGAARRLDLGGRVSRCAHGSPCRARPVNRDGKCRSSTAVCATADDFPAPARTLNLHNLAALVTSE